LDTQVSKPLAAGANLLYHGPTTQRGKNVVIFGGQSNPPLNQPLARYLGRGTEATGTQRSPSDSAACSAIQRARWHSMAAQEMSYYLGEPDRRAAGLEADTLGVGTGPTGRTKPHQNPSKPVPPGRYAHAMAYDSIHQPGSAVWRENVWERFGAILGVWAVYAYIYTQSYPLIPTPIPTTAPTPDAFPDNHLPSATPTLMPSPTPSPSASPNRLTREAAGRHHSGGLWVAISTARMVDWSGSTRPPPCTDFLAGPAGFIPVFTSSPDRRNKRR